MIKGADLMTASQVEDDAVKEKILGWPVRSKTRFFVLFYMIFTVSIVVSFFLVSIFTGPSSDASVEKLDEARAYMTEKNTERNKMAAQYENARTDLEEKALGLDEWKTYSKVRMIVEDLPGSELGYGFTRDYDSGVWVIAVGDEDPLRNVGCFAKPHPDPEPVEILDCPIEKPTKPVSEDEENADK